VDYNRPQDNVYDVLLIDVLLLVEVADTSFAYDHEIKLPTCAAAGIQEYWIEDLRREQLLVYREPSGGAYVQQLTRRRGDAISPLAFPDLVIPIDDLLG
jgi:Uma2 family endonuclease